MIFDFDRVYVEGNSIPHVDALSRLRFTRSQKIKEEFEDTFLHWVEIDALPLDRMAAETILSRITLRMRKNIWGKLFQGGKTLQRHKLTIERGVICNGDLIILSDTQRKLRIKTVYDDIHGGVAATHKKDEIRRMVAGIFTRCRRIYKKMQKI